jgi:hypothetical protein
MDTIPNAAGCDSVMTLNLTINNSTSSTQTATACNSYVWNNNTYTVSGTYMDTIPNAAGCDSVMTLNLTINTVNTSVIDSGSFLTANAAGASYQWLDCNNNYSIIAGATNQTYTPSASGNYAVAVTQNNCTDTSACYNITTINISENTKADDFIIFPNPFSVYTVLQTNNPFHNATLTVDNCFGQTVAQIKNISGQAITFNRDNLPSGLYFIRLTEDNKQIETQKIIITD